MSLRIKYDSQSPISILPYYLTGKSRQQAYAYDGLDPVMHNLLNIAARLENRLDYFGIQKNYPATVMRMRMTIMDAWAMIDHAALAIDMFKNIGGSVQKSDEDLVRRIGLLRNAYQHVDEIISGGLVKTGGSILGNLCWLQPGRQMQDSTRELAYKMMLITGIQFSGKFETVLERVNDPSITEICNVDLHYNIREKGSNDPKEIVIRLDEIVDFINRTIEHIEGLIGPTLAQMQELVAQMSMNYNFGLPLQVMRIKYSAE